MHAALACDTAASAAVSRAKWVASLGLQAGLAKGMSGSRGVCLFWVFQPPLAGLPVQGRDLLAD